MHYIKFHIKTLKIAPTCFDPYIILREQGCNCSKEQCSSLRMILGSKHVGAI